MRLVFLLVFLAMTPTADANRKDFATKIATIKPGMTADQVKKVLGPPDDIKTEKDPGGITAARTVEVWRYGASGHLKVGTLGTVHIQADKKVQYVFGGSGTPFTAIPEVELRRLLELLDAVPSYSGVLEPLPLIRAVNALQPLGKDRALDVITEYLRVSSWLDDPGREGVFLVLRMLFEPPYPPMMVGAPTYADPNDPKLMPRYPLIVVDDVPLKVVSGYMLGGEAEPPEAHVALFRKSGVLRKTLLAPSPTMLDSLDAAMNKLPRIDDGLRTYLIDQALRFFGTVHRPANMTIDSWFVPGKNWKKEWTDLKNAVGKLGAKWNAKTQQLELPDGSTLPALPRGFQRVWWDVGLKNTAKSRLTMERKSDQIVDVEFRLELNKGSKVAREVVRFIDPQTNKEIATLDFAGLQSPANSTSGSVTGLRLELARGNQVRLELASGARGPTLTP